MYMHFCGCQRGMSGTLEATRSNLIYIITPQINAKYCVFNSWVILLFITLWKSSSAIPAVAGLAVHTHCRGGVVAIGRSHEKSIGGPGGVIADLPVPRGVHHPRTRLTATRHAPGTFWKKEESPPFVRIYAEIIWIPQVQELFQLMRWIRLDCAFL